MREDQADTIIELLAEISEKLGNRNFYGRSLDDIYDVLDRIENNTGS